jgi:choloylglycine hydrolase
MEFSEPLNSKLVVVPKGNRFISATPSCFFEWISIYGYVGIRVLNLRSVVDGVNEMGLSCGILTMDETIYQPVTGVAISIMDVCSWLLGSFSNVIDAVTALQKVQIWGSKIESLGRTIGLHIVMHDSLGANVVCEILGSHNITIHNTNGVVTNGPPYPEQLRILDEYRNGSMIDNKQCSQQWSSITRFIKLSELKRMTVPEPLDSAGIANHIMHLFNNVDIVKGVSPSERPTGIIYEKTQWCFVKDLTNRIIYYRSYNDMTLRRLNLKDIDFSGLTTYTEIDIDSTTPTIIDIKVQ